jgi:hypothetical protein
MRTPTQTHEVDILFFFKILYEIFSQEKTSKHGNEKTKANKQNKNKTQKSNSNEHQK